MSTSGKICNGASTKSNDDDVCDVSDMVKDISVDKYNHVSVCASCGKEDANNICNKCKQVKYCNAACKKKHRSKHKKQCERRVAELHDEKLFRQPPPPLGDCQICSIRLPSLNTGHKYQTCCGKIICSGCIHAPLYDNQGNKVDNKKCPFCRTPHPNSNDEAIERLKKRVDVEDPIAIQNQGIYYQYGKYGFPQDYDKALELYHRAAELGHAAGYNSIGYAYYKGEGVEVDKKKAIHYFELAAMGGDIPARRCLGSNEYLEEGNIDRALKHFMIAVRSGHSDSLNMVKELYSKGQATKEDYTKALLSYQGYLGEIKSVQRDKAAADREDYRYIR